jgi:putative sterol carrier protein
VPNRPRTAKSANASASAEFFDRLGRSGHEPLLRQAKGTMSVELTNGRVRRWRVTVDNGKVEVSRERGPADCSVRTSAALFDGMVRGEVNAMAAVLRGAVEVAGDPRLLMLFQRLFPGPDGPAPAAEARR